MATAKIQTQGFKTAVHKPMGDVTDAKSIIYTVCGSILMFLDSVRASDVVYRAMVTDSSVI